MTGNAIPKVQNEEPQLKLLRARTRIYGLASRILVAQLVLTLLIPALGAIFVLLVPSARASIAALALLITALDVLVLDRRQKLLIKRAAKVGESFDCAVLELPWDRFNAGEPLEIEDIHAAARAYARYKDDSGLRDWYPVAAGQAPLHLARIICQRTNLRYDSQLRRSYGTIIVSIASAILLLLFIGGFVQNLKLSDWVLTMAPASPILTWAAREYYRQNDAADSLEEHLRAAKALWALALAGKCDADYCFARSREFQNAIYYRRASSTLIVPLLYRFKRLQLEDDMNEAAANFLADYQNTDAGTE
jgi:SMODS-associating 4TM effector domain